MARAKRYEAQLLVVSQNILAFGADVIWDMGFMERDHRDRIMADLADTPNSVRLYVLDAPADVRRKRVRRRNAEKSEGYVTEVTDEIFDFIERRSVRVSPDEAQDIIHIDTS